MVKQFRSELSSTVDSDVSDKCKLIGGFLKQIPRLQLQHKDLVEPVLQEALEGIKAMSSL